MSSRQSTATAAPSPRPVVTESATWRDRSLVPVLVYVGLLVAVISSLGAPLVPTVASDYGVSIGTAQWMLTIALLVGAVSAPVVGRLADGPRRLHVLVTTLSAMTIGSVLASLPLDAFWLLLLGRGLQGVGLSLLPLVMGIARDHLDPERARSTLATLSVTAIVGVGLGYPLTGLIADHVTYRAAFGLAAGLCAVALLLALLVVPTSAHRSHERFDLVGAALLAVGLGSLMLGISTGEDWGWGSGRILVLLAVAAIVLAGWTWQQTRSPSPLVDLRLMRNPLVASANVSGILAGVGMYVLMSIVIRFVQTPRSTGYGLGVSVLVGSLVLLPLSVSSLLSSKLATILGRRLGPGQVVSIGMLAFTAALLFFIADRSHLWAIFVVMGIAGLGIGCSFAVMPRMIVAAVPPEKTGRALALNQVLRQVGFSVGSALSATILTAHTSAPSPYPTDDGFTVAAWVAVGMCLVTAATSLAMQRRARRPAPGADDRLLADENVDSAVAGAVGYEPDEPRRA